MIQLIEDVPSYTPLTSMLVEQERHTNHEWNYGEPTRRAMQSRPLFPDLQIKSIESHAVDQGNWQCISSSMLLAY